jgi:hypothetical protein
MLVGFVERADDTEIQRNVAAFVFRIGGNQDIAGVHIGMKEPIAKHLSEKNLHAGARQSRNIHLRCAQCFDLRNRRAAHPLHDHDILRAPRPMHFGHQQQRRICEIAPQLCAVGRLAHQVQFVVQIFVELGDHFARLQPPRFRPEPFQPAGGGAQQREIVIDHRADAGSQNLHRDFVTAIFRPQRGEVHLRHRGRSHRLAREAGEHLDYRLAIGGGQRGFGQVGGERRHPILQLGQFVGQVGGQQVAAGGQHLTELDEDRPQVFQRAAQTLAARRRQVAPEQQPGQAQGVACPKTGRRHVIQQDAIQPIKIDHARDAKNAKEAHEQAERMNKRSKGRERPAV